MFNAGVCQGFGGGKEGKPIAQAACDTDILLRAVRAHKLKAWIWGALRVCLLERLEAIGVTLVGRQNEAAMVDLQRAEGQRPHGQWVSVWCCQDC